MTIFISVTFFFYPLGKQAANVTRNAHHDRCTVAHGDVRTYPVKFPLNAPAIKRRSICQIVSRWPDRCTRAMLDAYVHLECIIPWPAVTITIDRACQRYPFSSR